MSFNPLRVDAREQEYNRMQMAKADRERRHAEIAGIQDRINHSNDWNEIRMLEDLRAPLLKDRY